MVPAGTLPPAAPELTMDTIPPEVVRQFKLWHAKCFRESAEERLAVDPYDPDIEKFIRIVNRLEQEVKDEETMERRLR